MAVDWNSLLGDLQSEVVNVLRTLLDGAEEDIKTFGTAIASDMVRAIRDGNELLEQELVAQAKVLGEINRVRAVRVTWDEVGSVLTSLGKMALKGVAAVII